MDSIKITELTIKTRIGIHAWEQAIEQTLKIDITVPIEITKPNPQLEDTVDYAKICELVMHHVESQSFSLIENVAESTANLLKKAFNLKKIELTVHKPNAVPQAKNISLNIKR